jgi:hypothetical protein
MYSSPFVVQQFNKPTIGIIYDLLDLLDLIPDSVKNLIRDGLVSSVADLANKYIGGDIANKIKKLR